MSSSSPDNKTQEKNSNNLQSQNDNTNNKNTSCELSPKDKKDELTNNNTQQYNEQLDSPLLTPIPKEPRHQRFVVTGGLDDSSSPLNTDKEAATDALFDSNSEGNTSSFSDLSQLSPLLLDKTPQKDKNEQNTKKRSAPDFDSELTNVPSTGTSRQHAMEGNDRDEPSRKRQRIRHNIKYDSNDNDHDNENDKSKNENEFSEVFIPGQFNSFDDSTLNNTSNDKSKEHGQEENHDKDDSLSNALKTPLSKKKRKEKSKQSTEQMKKPSPSKQKVAQFHQQSVKQKRSRNRNATPNNTHEPNHHSTRSPEELHLQSTSFQGMDEDEEPEDDDDFVPSSKRLKKELKALSRKERQQREESKNPDQLNFNRYSTSPDEIVKSDVFVTPRRPKRRFERRKPIEKVSTPQTPVSPRHHDTEDHEETSPKESSPKKMTVEEEKKWKEKQEQEVNRLKNFFHKIDDVDLEEEDVLEV
eukprot:gb/GECH01002877.1/.p1 GENE.gb/GECH01002877.1/~~gb/GECH01002877.1/.p1  ORF type:complete len:470 (+),score=184.20 gb/GECH01002877.1/:1-1410(+)